MPVRSPFKKHQLCIKAPQKSDIKDSFLKPEASAAVMPTALELPEVEDVILEPHEEFFDDKIR